MSQESQWRSSSGVHYRHSYSARVRLSPNSMDTTFRLFTRSQISTWSGCFCSINKACHAWPSTAGNHLYPHQLIAKDNPYTGYQTCSPLGHLPQMVGLLLARQKSRDMRSCFSSSKTWDLLTAAYLLTHPPDVMMFLPVYNDACVSLHIKETWRNVHIQPKLESMMKLLVWKPTIFP